MYGNYSAVTALHQIKRIKLKFTDRIKFAWYTRYTLHRFTQIQLIFRCKVEIEKRERTYNPKHSFLLFFPYPKTKSPFFKSEERTAHTRSI